MESNYKIHIEPSYEQYFDEGQILKYKIGPKEGKFKAAELDLSEEDFSGIMDVFEPQYLYIVSDETPEKEDICLFPNGLIARYTYPMDGQMMNEAKRIIATDNPDIIDEYNKTVIPTSFAEDYVKILNEGNDIEVFNVERNFLSTDINYKTIKK